METIVIVRSSNALNCNWSENIKEEQETNLKIDNHNIAQKEEHTEQ